MRADQPVGRGAADKKAAGEQPEVARAHPSRNAEHRDNRDCASDCGSDFHRPRRRMVRARDLRPVPHQQSDDRDQRQRHAGDASATLRASHNFDEGREDRRKTSWPVAVARGQHPHDEPAPRREPARDDGGAEHQRRGSAAGADDKPHSRYQLPGPRHQRGQRDAERNEASATSTVRRSPKRSMTAAANGPISRKRNMLIPIAKEIVARDQPNSLSSGTISTPGVARRPAATKQGQKRDAATTQA